MCLVLLTYTADLEAVDAHLPAHVAWLEEAMRAGVMVLAGRRQPRTGGVLLFHGEPEAVEAVAATDPFVVEGVATFEVIAFSTSFATAAMREAFAR
ncbi:hypothetical protein FBR43_04185 [Sphingomonas baiyangensis]|uniref:YCII-related domain-containing protein n=2 Tax=Sphingomonas baiyangensis TaxID=2572576 RepID=A0A4U1L585_9SPHN|nr:hypothetical protein FBR43_04185 [Sphingomonas baiyangensis]